MRHASAAASLCLAAALALTACDSGTASTSTTTSGTGTTPAATNDAAGTDDTAPDATASAADDAAPADAPTTTTAPATTDPRVIMARAAEELKALNLPATAINIDDTAPAFSLPDATGTTVALADLLAKGPVVVTFYRGGWCPYCNRSLKEFQDRLTDITAAGATLVAISPETPDNALSTAEKSALQFAVLSDASNAVAKQFGIVFPMNSDLVTVYRGFGVDLEAHNNDPAWTLPLPATYVIDTAGVVRYAYLNEDYTQRATPDEVLAVLKTLN